jgi:hypothetical protein
MLRPPPVPRSRQKFSAEEDALLRDIVENKRASTWAEAVVFFPGRNARQLRDRWSNYVNPAITATPWTAEEDALLEEKYAQLGAKWQFIAPSFPNRSKAQLKCQWLAKHRPANTATVQTAVPEPQASAQSGTVAPRQSLLPFQLEAGSIWASFEQDE